MPLAKLKLSNEEHHCMLFYVKKNVCSILYYTILSASNKAVACFLSFSIIFLDGIL